MSNIDLNFDAVSIDNATLKCEGYKFREGLLAQLQQFKESPVQIVQTDIVHNEAKKHIAEDISKTRSSISKALRSANKQLKISVDRIEQARGILSIDGNDEDVAENRIFKFYEQTGAEIIRSDTFVDLESLMDLYFSTKPPFETGKDKKNEFPDAIALLSLEGWADENDINILAVSQDKGWKNYADKISDRITVVNSLSEALEKLQPHSRVSSIIAKIREDSVLTEGNHILERIEQVIVDSIDGYDIYVEASSPFNYEYDETTAAYIEHEFDTNSNDMIDVSIIRIDEESIVLQLGATVEVEVEACFDFAVRDSIDKDYVGMGSSTCGTRESYHTDILLTLHGNFSEEFDQIEVSKVEVLESISHANFGEVEPDWRHEEYEE